MTWGLTAIAAATVVSAAASSSAANRAASTQASAATQAAATQSDAIAKAAAIQAASADRAADLQYKMWLEQKGLQEPWRQAGLGALAQMPAQYNAMPAAFAGRSNAMPAPFSGKVDLTQDPGYAFRLSEGLKGLERSAAARGGLLSGATLKGIERYGQDLASQEYGNAYNRALTQYNAAVQREQLGYSRSLDEYNAAVARENAGYNRLANMAGIGQTTSQALSSQAGQYATSVGNIYQNAAQAQATGITNAAQAQAAGITNAASARASGYLGTANALNQALGQGINLYGLYNQNQLFNRIFPPA